MEMVDRQQKELEALVTLVLKKRNKIIPIVGDDCFVGSIDNEERQILVPLQQWIAEELLGDDSSSEIKCKVHSEGYRGLDILFEEYKRINKEDSYFDYKNAVISIVEKGIESNRLFLRSDVKDFLLAGKFEVIVTTCPYCILEKELMRSGRPYHVSSFAPISIQNESKSEAILELPSIYQLFGDCEGEFVGGEEDLLKFLHHLNQTDTEKGFGASQLVKYIKDKDFDNKGMGLLMPIGCNNLPNWLFRFLWYPFSYECLKSNDRNSQGGIWHKHCADECFYSFLRKYRFKTFSGPIEIFRNENIIGDSILVALTKEFKKQEKEFQEYASERLQIQWKDSCDWDFFISYASEDKVVAKMVYDILTNECGKKVWMDKRGRVNWGDEYWKIIQHGIDHSQKFVFIITEAYLRKAIDKNHKYDFGIAPTGVYQELELIKRYFLRKKLDMVHGYSYPLIVDGTKVTYTDYNGNLHKDEILKNGILEKLPKSDEYKMLPDVLFAGIEDFICTEESLEEELIRMFKN
ncbi:MAG: toll/interleukin-1 receptor domain-containing protein [Paraprevotella sp.]|nr:toll/interleukin-1 receptor domain-containing protein [Paraprevotella sp.]